MQEEKLQIWRKERKQEKKNVSEERLGRKHDKISNKN